MEVKITVIGLGYVGFPLAYELSNHFEVIGYDTNTERIKKYKQGINPIDFNKPIDYLGRKLSFTDNLSNCGQSNVYIIAVPTPVDENMQPKMDYLYEASKAVGSILNKSDIVIYESTVYPTATESECIPLIEETSGLSAITDFKYGYSPERVSPGASDYSFINVTKVIAGCDHKTTDIMEQIYGTVIHAPLYRATNVKTAEAIKITENVQRDVNIALINELSQLYKKLDIDIYDVIDGASTKWNFSKYLPGMVGGHCISVDPYYLIHQSKKYNMKLNIIKSSRHVNEQYFKNFTNRIVAELFNMHKGVKKVLLLGAAYKENVNDFRNTKVVHMYHELINFGIDVTLSDDYINSSEFFEEFHIQLQPLKDIKDFDLVFIYQPHDLYRNLSIDDFQRLLFDDDSIIFDYRRSLNDTIKKRFNVVQSI